MSDTRMQKTHDFGYLNEWAFLSDDQLGSVCSEETMAILARVVRLLGNDKENSCDITQENFIDTVRSMRLRYEEGSKGLGEAIIKAGDYLNKNMPDEAEEFYSHFLKIYPSTFYRNIDVGELGKIVCRQTLLDRWRPNLRDTLAHLV